MTKNKIIIGAVLCGILLTGCERNSDSESSSSPSGFMDGALLSDMMDSYKSQIISSEGRGQRIPQYSGRDINDPYDKNNDYQIDYRGHIQSPGKPGYNGKVPNMVYH